MIAEKFIFQTIFNSSPDVGVKSFETQYLDAWWEAREAKVSNTSDEQRDIAVSRNMVTLLRHHNQLVA